MKRKTTLGIIIALSIPIIILAGDRPICPTGMVYHEGMGMCVMYEDYVGSEIGGGGGDGTIDHTGGVANMYCPIWNIEVVVGGGTVGFPSVKCTTGGSWKCKSGVCPHGG